VSADILTFDQSTATTPEQTQPRFITPEQHREIKRQEQHRQRVLKKREQRWASPAADAKVEDLMLVAQDIKNLVDTIDVLNREMYLIRTALFNAKVISEADLTALRERQKQREEKFKELQANVTMSREEKVAIATEYELPLHLLGLQEETPPIGDVQ
jgi:hypothetical protein